MIRESLPPGMQGPSGTSCVKKEGAGVIRGMPGLIGMVGALGHSGTIGAMLLVAASMASAMLGAVGMAAAMFSPAGTAGTKFKPPPGAGEAKAVGWIRAPSPGYLALNGGTEEAPKFPPPVPWTQTLGRNH